jgi:hypothetical protein
MKRFFGRVCLLWVLVCACVQAHELQEHKLQMVLRDDRHLIMSLWLDIPNAMRKTLEPSLSSAAFEMKYSAMPLPLFEKAWGQCISAWREQWQLKNSAGGAVSSPVWRWPDGAALQNQIKLQMMANVTGTAHAHAESTVIAGEVVSNSMLQSARLQMPMSWKPMMVVSYKPSQQWTPSSEKPVLLKF